MNDPQVDTRPELGALFGLEGQLEPRPWKRTVAITVVAHLVLIYLLREVPMFEGRSLRSAAEVVIARKVTPIFAPVLEPTQNQPNKRKVNRDFDVESLKPRPQVQLPEGAPSTTRGAARVAAPVPPAPVTKTAEAPKPLMEPPKVVEPVVQAKSVTPAAAGVPNAPPPQIQTQEKPKLAFEAIGSGGYTPGPGEGLKKIEVPTGTVSEAVRALARSRPAGGLTVGDNMSAGIGGLGPAINQPPSPGKTGSNLELLTDPQGVDFRPYLIAVLAKVRGNWFAVLPESARLGNQRGSVVVQFAIDREGKVPKLVISVPSGSSPLDRAAVAGISASYPFPPLPNEFRGEQIRLQFTFSYNSQRR